jgi:hypothetical protein
MFIKPAETYQWTLDLNMFLGFIVDFDETGTKIDYTWVDLFDQQPYDHIIKKYNLNHNGICLEILIDDQSIFNQNLTNQPVIKISQLVQDTDNLVDHKLKFKVSGYRDCHMPLIGDNTSLRATIKLAGLKFESIALDQVFDTNAEFKFNNNTSMGGVIFSGNTESVLKFQTPIYQWLLENVKLQQSVKFKLS